MIEQKHTPGPWSYEGGDNASCEVNAGSTTVSIPRWDKNTGVHVIDRDEMEANAKLIASAPELLQALIHLSNANPNDDTWNYVAAMEAARKAINKATL